MDSDLVLGRYLKKFSETTYQKDFGWVDKVRELTDQSKIDELDTKVLEQFHSGSFDKTWMAVPVVVEWERIEGFRYGAGTKEELKPDLHVSDLRASFRDASAITRRSLQRVVRAYQDGGLRESYHWPAYRCLYSEVNDGDHTYLLTNGKWFRLSTDFVESVDDELRSLQERTDLPDYAHHSEGEYNRALVASDPQRLALMDAKNIPYGGGYSKIEFCDCYADDGEMIHVKRYAGSSVLSHLFQQGVVSANLWTVSSEFRDLVNHELPPSHRLADPQAPLERGRYRVTFAITSNRNYPLLQSLPFFSRLTLKNAVILLRGFGYEVQLQRIRDTT